VREEKEGIAVASQPTLPKAYFYQGLNVSEVREDFLKTGISAN